VDGDPAEEDVDLEGDLEAVDVDSFALTVVALGFNAPVFDSIPAATAPVSGNVGDELSSLPRSV